MRQHTSSGYQILDTLTGGFIRGGVTLIASRPAVGKSSLVLNMVSRLSRQMTGSILVFSPRFQEADRKSTRLNSSHKRLSRMPSSA